MFIFCVSFVCWYPSVLCVCVCVCVFLETEKAAHEMTRWSGKVVALSGAILSLTYLCLVFYPMEMLQSVGLGASVAIVCTILVNLTLTPALMMAFPKFFTEFGCTCKCGTHIKDTNQDANLLVNIHCFFLCVFVCHCLYAFFFQCVFSSQNRNCDVCVGLL